jgi:hypothetical protein
MSILFYLISNKIPKKIEFNKNAKIDIYIDKYESVLLDKAR